MRRPGRQTAHRASEAGGTLIAESGCLMFQCEGAVFANCDVFFRLAYPLGCCSKLFVLTDIERLVIMSDG